MQIYINGLLTGGVSVAVTDENREPVSEAIVQVIKNTESGGEIRETTTGIDGAYSIDAVPYGVYSLVITHGERTNTSIIIINSEEDLLQNQIKKLLKLGWKKKKWLVFI